MKYKTSILGISQQSIDIASPILLLATQDKINFEKVLLLQLRKSMLGKLSKMLVRPSHYEA